MIVTGPSLTSETAILAPKTPVSTGTPSAAQFGAETLVERLGLRWRCGGGEARTVALRRVGQERELADDERSAAGVEQGAVEPALAIGEDPQPRDLPRQPGGGVGVVVGGDAEQDAEAGSDRAARRRRGPRDALDDRSHSRSRMRELYCSDFGFIECASL